MIYSFDRETCACIEIKYMECHPQYNNDCNQAKYDQQQGRLTDNPYADEEWYQAAEATINAGAGSELGIIPDESKDGAIYMIVSSSFAAVTILASTAF